MIEYEEMIREMEAFIARGHEVRDMRRRIRRVCRKAETIEVRLNVLATRVLPLLDDSRRKRLSCTLTRVREAWGRVPEQESLA